MTVRGVFYEEEQARAAARSLLQDGFQATVLVERLAGEDDDEDHPWAVVTDAPEYLVEMLADAHDGWVDHDGPGTSPPSAVPPPPDLPDAPRRIKGHFTDERRVADE